MSYGNQTPPITELPLFAYEPQEEPEFAPAYQPASPTKLSADSETLLAFLQANAVGKANAIRGNEIVARLGLKNPQQLRLIVQSLRNGGHLVLATIAGGYYIAADVVEFKDFLSENYLNRMIAMADASNAMLASARVTYGQPAHEIPGIKVVRTEHPELPERFHV